MPVSMKGIPRKLVETIVENNGNDPSRWNQELRDLFDTTIEPELCSTPISGKVDKFLNPTFTTTGRLTEPKGTSVWKSCATLGGNLPPPTT